MRDSFIFYESFREIFELLDNAEEWKELLSGIFRYVFDEQDSFFTDSKLQIAFTHCRVSIDNASAKYDKAIAEGKKGGRPSKKVFIPPDKWIGEIEKCGSIPKAAKALGLAKSTLYQWVSVTDDPRLEKVRKSENLSLSVSLSDSVSESESDKRKNNNLGNGTADADAPPRTEERNAASRREDDDYEPTQEESLSVIRRLIADTQEKERVNGNERERDTS